MDELKILDELKNAVIEGDKDQVIHWSQVAISEGINPIQAIQKGLTIGITAVGDAFSTGDVFLPQLVMSADAMKAGSALFEAEILRLGIEDDSSQGKIIIGTVQGDVHDIGKTIVSTILSAEGFDVIDLGINVTPDQFIDTAIKKKADIIALSALLSTTIREQARVIQSLEEKGIRDNFRVLIGGGAVTSKFAEDIGADGYGADAVDAVRWVKATLGTD
ncbi:MAG: corrinoid protein [Anaerolineales bacterium]|nr:corrinoid protein [Anaerolineales bacterium]